MGKITQEKNINERKFSVTQFGTRKSTKVFAFLMRCGLPTIIQGALALQNFRFDKDAEVNSEEIVSAVVMLLGNLNDENIDKIYDELYALTFVEGQEVLPQMDILFQGDLRFAAEVLVFSFEVNYGSFLGVNLLEKIFGKVKANQMMNT